MDAFTLEWGVFGGLLTSLAGAVLFVLAFLSWQKAGFQGLSCGDNLRKIIPASTLIILGFQMLFGSFFLGVLGMKTVIRSDAHAEI